MNKIDALISHSIYNRHDPIDINYYEEQKRKYDNYEKTINFFKYNLWTDIEMEIRREFIFDDIFKYDINISLFKAVPFATIISGGNYYEIKMRYEIPRQNYYRGSLHSKDLFINLKAEKAQLFINIFDKFKEAITSIDSLKNEIETIKYQIELGNYYSGYNGDKIDYTGIDKLI